MPHIDHKFSGLVIIIPMKLFSENTLQKYLLSIWQARSDFFIPGEVNCRQSFWIGWIVLDMSATLSHSKCNSLRWLANIVWIIYPRIIGRSRRRSPSQLLWAASVWAWMEPMLITPSWIPDSGWLSEGLYSETRIICLRTKSNAVMSCFYSKGTV